MAKSGLKEFRKANDLTQTDVSDFLGGIGKSFISQIEHGLCELPSKHLEKLLNNNQGWDTTPLVEDNSTNITASGNAEVNIHSKNQYRQDNEELISLRKENEMLRQQLEDMKAQLNRCWTMIDNLTKK